MSYNFISKKWGWEAEIFNNDIVSCWLLHIDKGASTSLHSHPNKKTSLVVLNGAIKLGFMNSSVTMGPGEKMIIRHGVFHKSKAVSGDVLLLETETPPDKNNIVRLEDDYGRVGRPMETPTIVENLPTDVFSQAYETMLSIISWQDIRRAPQILHKVESLVILDGGLKDNFGTLVVGPSDAISTKTLSDLVTKFGWSPTTFYAITNNYTKNHV